MVRFLQFKSCHIIVTFYKNMLHNCYRINDSRLVSPGYGPGGWGFESSLLYFTKNTIDKSIPYLLYRYYLMI